MSLLNHENENAGSTQAATRSPGFEGLAKAVAPYRRV